MEFRMNVLEIFSSQLGLTLWTAGVSAALILASSLCIYLLPWRARDIRQTHAALKDTISPLQSSTIRSHNKGQLLHTA